MMLRKLCAWLGMAFAATSGFAISRIGNPADVVQLGFSTVIPDAFAAVALPTTSGTEPLPPGAEPTPPVVVLGTVGGTSSIKMWGLDRIRGPEKVEIEVALRIAYPDLTFFEMPAFAGVPTPMRVHRFIAVSSQRVVGVAAWSQDDGVVLEGSGTPQATLAIQTMLGYLVPKVPGQ